MHYSSFLWTFLRHRDTVRRRNGSSFRRKIGNVAVGICITILDRCFNFWRAMTWMEGSLNYRNRRFQTRQVGRFLSPPTIIYILNESGSSQESRKTETFNHVHRHNRKEKRWHFTIAQPRTSRRQKQVGKVVYGEQRCTSKLMKLDRVVAFSTTDTFYSDCTSPPSNVTKKLHFKSPIRGRARRKKESYSCKDKYFEISLRLKITVSSQDALVII